MKTLTLNVTISNGTSVLGIIFKLFEDGEINPVVEEVEYQSFTKTLNLKAKTKYNLFLIGSNPLADNGRTMIQLLQDNFMFDDTSDRNPTIRTGKSYLVTYSFNTN